MKRFVTGTAILAFAFSLLACGASTTVKTMWTDETFNPKETPFKKVLIMGVYEQQIQATAKSYNPEMGNIEQNGGDIGSSGAPGSDPQVYEWADVLRDLEPWY